MPNRKHSDSDKLPRQAGPNPKRALRLGAHDPYRSWERRRLPGGENGVQRVEPFRTGSFDQGALHPIFSIPPKRAGGSR
jgi:hypothetical protein